MVVYGEAGRGKITFLGKLHYRISYLMYLNHRWVDLCFFCRVLGVCRSTCLGKLHYRNSKLMYVNHRWWF